jgi:mannose-1-phosphate guanylyltransferase/phosphomannomutase
MRGGIDKAMILAAGQGMRLIPLTLNTPKVLLPIGGVPLIEYTIAWLKTHDISQIIINLCHLGQKVKNYLGDGSKYGIDIFYSVERTTLGTAGGTKKAKHYFDGTFVVAYGDIFTNLNLTNMIQFHREKKAIATIAVSEVEIPHEVGIIIMDNQSRITNFIEKPTKLIDTWKFGNGGVYILEMNVFDYIPNQKYSDFAYDIFPKLIKHDLPVFGYSLIQEEYLIDIGTFKNYKKANEYVQKAKSRYFH